MTDIKYDKEKALATELWEAIENGTVEESFFQLREKVRRQLADKIEDKISVISLIADDSFAIKFQTIEHYREALLKAINN